VREKAPKPESIVPEISIPLSRRVFWDLTPPPTPLQIPLEIPVWFILPSKRFFLKPLNAKIPLLFSVICHDTI